jgi:malonyl-CoA decarboxylase
LTRYLLAVEIVQQGIRTMDQVAPRSFLDRTLRNLRVAWRGRSDGDLAPDLPEAEIGRLKRQIDACLRARGGEVSARVRAADLGRSYLGLSETGRRRFLILLAEDYDVDEEALQAATVDLVAADSAEARRHLRRRLRQALVPPRVKLLTQFNALPQGVKFLVDMRADLRALLGQDVAALDVLDDDLRELLTSWFDVGFLDLAHITWASPAALLEKLIAYEAVHQIRSWEDMKNRLDFDRRCYAFFHPRMPDEPLIFIEVALVKGMTDSVQDLLDQTAPKIDPATADTAIFYSISNAQAGLIGVSFGSFLIKRVVDDLRRDLGNLKTFATLSPVPGFMAWLGAEIEARGEELLRAVEAEALTAAAGMAPAAAALRALLDRPAWYRDEAQAAVLQPVLMRLCAVYLLEVRNGERTHDRVAHFHLTNGARLERLNWLADTSENGLAQSAGIMVNYLYRLADIEKNHEAYRGAGRIAAATKVRRLL